AAVMLVELLLRAACVSLLLPGGQGRGYPGRKKPASFAVERRRVGPHVCFSGFGSGCCPGWMLAPGSGQCTLREYGVWGARGGPCPPDTPCHPLNGDPGGTGGPRGPSGIWGPGGPPITPHPPPDIDECLRAACEGPCVNTEGGFVCECGPGMQLAADRHSCQDTDECLATPCQHRCKNSVGSYRCSCRPGYHLHGNRHSCV
ncbi:VWCE protein, partial [Pterocles burchelli]|nr:VWCE protein [Pterocles burchelli]